ncbi:phosphoribosylformylglycinamidine synthase [Coemansia sp. RSA 2708]|nr:phosphoribosylformylglycinamidine synthase [Coemansia sp. RSA 2708]
MLLRTPGESGAPQVVIQRVLGDQDPDFEKLKLADKVRELWMLPRRALYEPCPAAALIIAHSEPQPLREAPIHDSADGDELARPIRNIKAAKLQCIAEQNEDMTINVLARTNRELGLVLATDEIAYLIDAYLDMQATDAGIARNQTDAELMMFAQVDSKHCRHNICFRGRQG